MTSDSPNLRFPEESLIRSARRMSRRSLKTIFCAALLALVFLSAHKSLIAGILTGSMAIIPPGSTVNLTTNGTLDWVHWGTYTEYAFDRKAGVTPQIGALSTIGSDNKGYVFIYEFSDNTNGYAWMDGTPTATVTNTTTGVWEWKNANKTTDMKGAGILFTVPADTTLRRLSVYAGAFNARLRFAVGLSDGSAPAYVNTALINTNNGPSAVFTVVYAANSAGQMLYVTNILEDTTTQNTAGTPNVTLQAAALSSVTNNNLPSVWFNTPANATSFLSPTDLTLDVSALDIDGSVTNVEFFQDTNKLGEIASSPFTFVWSNAPVGRFVLTARATDDQGAVRVSLPIEVYGCTNGGAISGGFGIPVTSLSLSTNGTHDWAHWGLTSSNSFDHRAGVPSIIPNFSLIGTNGVLRLTNDFTKWSWTNGTPTVRVTNSATAVSVYGWTNGFELDLPAGTNSRTARIYTGLSEARGRMQATLSDWSAPVFTDESLQSYYKTTNRAYVITYNAASENQVLKVRFIEGIPFDQTYASVTLRSASMDVAAPLPFVTNPTNSAHYPSGANVPLSAQVLDWTGTPTLVEYFVGANKVGEATNPPFSATWTNATQGIYSVTATATDDHGAVGASAPVAVSIATNASPVVSIISPTNGARFIEGDVISLTTAISDPDDINFRVDYYGNGIFVGETTQYPYTYGWTNKVANVYSVNCITYDAHGGSGTSAPVAITVVTNAWPNVTIVSPTNGQAFFAPAEITISALPTDSDGTIKLVEYYSNGTKLGQLSSAPYDFVLTDVYRGTYVFTAKATDNRGATNYSAPVTVFVSNSPPVVAFSFPTNGAHFFETTNLLLQADASDPDGSVTLVEFFNSTNRLGEAAAPSFSIIWSNVLRGDYDLTAVATDNDGATSVSAPITISIITNTPPVVAFASPTNGQGLFRPFIPVSLDASDTDGFVQLVNVFEGTNQIAQLTNAPFTFVWTNMQVGSFVLTATAFDDWNGISTSAPVEITVSNSPPAVVLTNPPDDAFFREPANIPLMAADSDADGNVAVVEFFAGTNSLGQVTNAPFALVWSNVVSGDYYFTARATDNDGAMSVSPVVHATVVFTNTPPAVEISSPTNGQAFIRPADVALVAAASDEDGWVTLVEFFESDTNKIGQATNAPFGTIWTNAPMGSHVLTARATDNWLGVTVSAPITITISNAPPVVAITNPTNGATFIEGDAVLLQAAASDVDGAITSLQFYDGTNLLVVLSNAPYSFIWTNVAVGTYTVLAIATDNDGATTISSNIDFIVVSNQPPTVAMSTPTNDAAFFAPANITVSADASDADGAVALVEFFANDVKIGQRTNAPFSVTWSNVLRGAYSLNARATDDRGATNVSASVNVFVSNSPPVVNLISPTNGAGFIEGDVIPVDIQATDPDGVVTSVVLLETTNVLTQFTNAPFRFAWSNVFAGTYSLSAQATDDQGAVTTSATVTVTMVTNQPPSVAIVTPTNGQGFAAPIDLPVLVTASDPDGHVARTELRVDGALLAQTNGSPLSMVWSNAPKGPHMLSALAVDDRNSTNVAESVTIEITNAPPVVNLLSPTNGAMFIEGDVITMSAVGSDPDGVIAWVDLFAGTNLLASLTNAPYMFAWSNALAGVYSLTALAVDDEGAQTTSAAITITMVTNQPPQVSFITPTNGQSYAAPLNLPINITASDSDGFVSVLEVWADGSLLAQTNGGLLNLTWTNVPKGLHSLAAFAVDDRGLTNSAAPVDILVTNAPPVITITAPTNDASFIEGDVITVGVEAWDPDGTIASVEIFEGTNVLASFTNAPFVFAWSNVVAGVYTLNAEVVDDEGAGAWSTNLTISVVTNQPPTVGIVTPTNVQVFFSPASITIESVAADTDGQIRFVEIFENTNKLISLTNGPYVFVWSNVLSGTYSFLSTATDDRGATTVSLPVDIIVNRTTPVLVLSNSAVAVGAGAFTFDFPTLIEWNYRVESSDSLESANWLVVTNISGTGSNVSISTDSSTNSQRFYRVIAQ